VLHTTIVDHEYYDKYYDTGDTIVQRFTNKMEINIAECGGKNSKLNV